MLGKSLRPHHALHPGKPPKLPFVKKIPFLGIGQNAVYSGALPLYKDPHSSVI